MQTYKKVIFAVLLITTLCCTFCQPAFALSESEIQAQVDTAGKEAVAGNVLIWFLCAVAFLKISQKIDSLMSCLGIHVGNTGGSMLAEAVIAARGIGSIRNSSGTRFGSSHNSRSTNVNSGSSGGFLSGGLAGVVSRRVTQDAIKNATAPQNGNMTGGGIGRTASGKTAGSGGSKPSNLGGHIYSASVNKGGGFANNIISTIATGNMAATGSITDDKAAEALHSYMGNAALEEGAGNIPTFSNVEIGGGRITGTETSEEHPEGIAFGMYHTAQYAAPDGNFSTVHAADGTAWYKQYVADAVEKSPYMAPDGSIAYNESIVKKLPPTPKRKGRL